MNEWFSKIALLYCFHSCACLATEITNPIFLFHYSEFRVSGLVLPPHQHLFYSILQLRMETIEATKTKLILKIGQLFCVRVRYTQS